MSASAAAAPAKFVTGSTMRHVAVMTLTGSVGLVAIFLVDFADMFFLSLLGQVAVAAAIGYAGTILFFNISIAIGITIAATALVSRALGAGDRDRARSLGMASILFILTVMAVIAALQWPFIPTLLDTIGADGEAKQLAIGYLRILVPSLPLLGFGMCCSGLMRAVGDAKRAMYVTLVGGAVNAVLDPIFIFALGLGVDGAALASVASRVALAGMGFYGAVVVHDLVARPNVGEAWPLIPVLSGIALPAVLTNVATPFGNAYITAAIAAFGDGPVAGWAIIGRLVPVAFGVIFALSGAIGPILGQNYGAGAHARVLRAYRDALTFCLGYVLVMWALLFVLQGPIIALFGATGEAAALISLFCVVVAGSFLFNGALFVSNAAFNTLGYPQLSTILNWSKATLGTIPFVLIGAELGGANGILVGQAVGNVLFGTAAALIAFRVISRLPDRPPPDTRPSARWSHALWPFSSGKSASAG